LVKPLMFIILGGRNWERRRREGEERERRRGRGGEERRRGRGGEMKRRGMKRSRMNECYTFCKSLQENPPRLLLNDINSLLFIS